MTIHSSRRSSFARDIRLSSAKVRQSTALVALFVAAAAFVILPSGPTWAQSATWLATPGSGDYSTSSNWTPATVPTDTATFGISATTNVTFSAGLTSVGGWTFNAGASSYTFSVGNRQLEFQGAGITINGGSATINNTSAISSLSFFNNSTAGNATINNTAFMVFNNSSTAGSATITNSGSGSIEFRDTSTAGSAQITNTASLSFTNNSTAGSATITTNSGGLTALQLAASGGTARFIVNGTGQFDLTELTTGGATAGSIEGDGNIFLGSKNLAVGSNNLSTSFSGTIADGGIVGGAGGSLTKVGTGALTLSGSNTYTGGTTLTGGAIVVGSNTALGTGTITFNGGTLQSGVGTFTLANNVQITAAGGTIDAAGQLLDLEGNITDAAGGGSGTLTFASSSGLGGTLLGGSNTYSAKTLVQTNESLIAVSTGAFSANSDYTINSGAALETNGFNTTVRSLSGTGTVSNDNDVSGTLTIALTSGTQTFQGNIIDNLGPFVGTLSVIKTGAGTQILSGTNTYSGGTTINAGALSISNDNNLGAASGGLTFGGGTLETTANVTSTRNITLQTSGTFQVDTGTTSFSNTIADGTGGPGSLTKTGAGTLTLSGSNTYSGGTTLTAGTIVAGSNTALGTGTITMNGGTLQSGASGLTLANDVQITSAGGTITGDQGQVFTLNGNITGGAGGTLTIDSSGAPAAILLGGTNTYSAKTIIDTNAVVAANSTGAFSSNSDYTINSGGALQTNGFNSTVRSLSGPGTVSNDSATSATLTIALTSGTQTFQGNIIDHLGPMAGTLSLVKTGAGTQILGGTNTYSGTTEIDGGTLEVDGAITNSSVTVNNGGTLAGAGSVIGTTINAGGILAPGNGTPGTSLTVNGNLALAPGSIYVVSVDPTTASFAAVTGTATIGGTAQANFANGNYISKTYKILTATGGVNGTFSGLSNNNLPNNFSDALTYDADNAYLNLTLNFVPPPSGPNFTPLNTNQANVANTLVKFFNTNGGIPTKFGTLSSAGLSQVDGEGNTGAEHTAFQLESQFLNAMLDPFISGRSGNEGAGNSDPAGMQPLGYTSEQSIFSPAVKQAYGRVLKGPPPAAVYTPHWNAWGTAFGGVSYSNGNTATGSNQLNANTFGFAAGIDYHLSADTLFGFALGGGGTNWQLAGLSGSGRSQALQTGIYAITRNGPLYGAAAFGFTNNWFTTNRTALGDQLQANFGGQSYGGRIEGGYHVVSLPFGITPYGALQVQDFETPNYSENDLTGGGFGLSYASMSATDVRTELGSRFEQATVLGAMPLILHGKLAWAHDFVSNPALNAAFQALPGTSFIVNGAPIPHNSALTSVGAELILAPNWSVLAKFDGEFAGTAQTYAGTGTLKYTW